MWVIKLNGSWMGALYFVGTKKYSKTDNPKDYTVQYSPKINNALMFEDYTQAELIAAGLEAGMHVSGKHFEPTFYEVVEVHFEISEKE